MWSKLRSMKLAAPNYSEKNTHCRSPGPKRLDDIQRWEVTLTVALVNKVAYRKQQCSSQRSQWYMLLSDHRSTFNACALPTPFLLLPVLLPRVPLEQAPKEILE